MRKTLFCLCDNKSADHYSSYFGTSWNSSTLRYSISGKYVFCCFPLIGWLDDVGWAVCEEDFRLADADFAGF